MREKRFQTSLTGNRKWDLEIPRGVRDDKDHPAGVDFNRKIEDQKKRYFNNSLLKTGNTYNNTQI
jgi:hypothetical protein